VSKFKDKTGKEWTIILDPILVEEVNEDHAIELTKLESDPLTKLRNDTMMLVAVVCVLCRDEREEMQMSRKDFVKGLKFPPDEMLAAVGESIIDFFPSGRASHVREVLTAGEEMAAVTDQIASAEMLSTIQNPETKTRLSSLAKCEIDRAIAELMKSTSRPATSNTLEKGS